MRLQGPAEERAVVALGLCLMLCLNLLMLVEAYPETTKADSGCCSDRILAKDFSAFYTAAWRLWNDPSNIYATGVVHDGAPAILPQPESFKYLPSFLFMVTPFLSLGYQQALTAFDAFQFLLLPLIALLVYKLTKEKGPAVTLAVAGLVLVLPTPWPNWGLSAAYYWQWGEGQSKVLETFILVASFYLGKSGRPTLSGVALALSAFDPRFTIISVPLFVTYNRASLTRAWTAFSAAVVVSNLPLLLPGTGSGFVTMLESSGLTTPIYYYAYIPIAAVLCLSLVNLREILDAFRSVGKAVRRTSR